MNGKPFTSRHTTVGCVLLGHSDEHKLDHCEVVSGPCIWVLQLMNSNLKHSGRHTAKIALGFGAILIENVLTWHDCNDCTFRSWLIPVVSLCRNDRWWLRRNQRFLKSDQRRSLCHIWVYWWTAASDRALVIPTITQAAHKRETNDKHSDTCKEQTSTQMIYSRSYLSPIFLIVSLKYFNFL